MTREVDRDEKLNEMVTKYTANRRRFLQNSAGLGMGFFGSFMLGACGGNSNGAVAQQDEGPNDLQILNFALNLEYLEAEFYLQAAIGENLPANLVGDNPGMVQGGRRVDTFTNGGTGIIQRYANEIAADERDHVRFLRTALGDAAVPRPRINIQDAFTVAAQAAGLINEGEIFDPYASEDNFLLAAYIFEDVGVSAYKGASPFASTDIIEAAAGLLAAEAYHAGLVRGVLFSRGAFDGADAISNARDSLDGDTDLDQGISPMDVTLNGQTVSASNIVPLDANGLAFSRSPGQVLNIVYLNPEPVSSGGFFPDGINGDIATSADSSGSAMT
ncbi:ferritin-like domain-containing protein [Spectribacter hydrogenoxidans]|uniref:Ferritin-like domain-containing protein n=1 Tax=Spectribacter hydrogenoxidans TaxID=3075608 RepID=A0ABU3BX84_9GAMM|nr:ferritin-like domain-containing protein [Salinisphaera sp. W335]MDT0633907.1 ferritin-like domain-containing protein [Salinisphaera sp. W335]